MAGRLVNALGSSALAAEAFSDLATLRHMLRFEACLAQAAAEAGLIPRRMAPIIAKACDPALYDPAMLAAAARRTATLTVPVVKALTEEVAKRDAEAAGYVHWGATSQDVIDTAMVLQLGEALPPLLKELDAIVAAFAALARKHRRTPMLGRTLLQPATPLALGQKIAGWASDIARAARRLEASFKETQILQFGGASGSLSALGDKAEPVMVSLAKRLKLDLPPAPWFTQRVRVAALIETLASAVQAMHEVAPDLAIDPDVMQANMDATEGAVLAERATFLLAATMGKQKAGKLVEEALAKGGSFVEALGQLEKELSDEMALLGYSPKFVDRLLADLKRK